MHVNSKKAARISKKKNVVCVNELLVSPLYDEFLENNFVEIFEKIAIAGVPLKKPYVNITRL